MRCHIEQQERSKKKRGLGIESQKSKERKSPGLYRRGSTRLRDLGLKKPGKEGQD